MQETKDDLLNVQQVADAQGVSRRTALRRIQNGDIPSHKLPGATGAYVVRRSDLASAS